MTCLRLPRFLLLLCSSVLGGAASSAACTSFGESVAPDAGGATEPGADDAGVSADARPSGCDPTTPFDAAVPVPGLATAAHVEYGAHFSPDERVAYFGRVTRDGGDDATYTEAAFTATRTSSAGEFSAFGRLSGEPPVRDGSPTVTADGGMFFFSRSDPKTGRSFIFEGSFSIQGVGFVDAKKLTGPVNEGDSQQAPYVTPDGNALYFSGESATGSSSTSIYRAARNGSGGYADVAVVAGLGAQNDSYDSSPVVTSDELTIYWSRSNTTGPPASIHVATRSDKSSKFSGDRVVSELDTADTRQMPSFISADRCRIYFSRSRQVGQALESDVFVASKRR